MYCHKQLSDASKVVLGVNTEESKHMSTSPEFRIE
jgi:hypothetical protein